MKEEDIVFEDGDVWVYRDRKQGRYTVFIARLTHSVSDSAYELTPDGLSIAIARAKYLAEARKS